MKDNRIVYILFLVIIFFSISGCDRSPRELTIYNSSWPDGTSVTLIDGNHLATRTTLYGSHTRLNIPQTPLYFIRAASSNHLTFLSDTLSIDSEHPSFSLPSPAPRLRIGSWRLGIMFEDNDRDSLYKNLLVKGVPSVTTISPRLLNTGYLPELVRFAHGRGIEITAAVQVTTLDISPGALADSAEVFGVDGIVAEPDSTMLFMKGFEAAFRTLTAELHQRGLTFTVKIPAECAAGNIVIPSGMRNLFIEAPSPEQPDELRIAFVCTGIPSFISAERIGEKIGELVRIHIPLSRISIELTLSAFKFQILDDGSLEPLRLTRGEMHDLIQKTGGHGTIRLRDGSLRFGYKGFLYGYEDSESLSEKIRLLRNGFFSRSAGVHVVYDSLGVEPSPEDLKRLVRSIRTP